MIPQSFERGSFSGRMQHFTTQPVLLIKVDKVYQYLDNRLRNNYPLRFFRDLFIRKVLVILRVGREKVFLGFKPEAFSASPVTSQLGQYCSLKGAKYVNI